MSEMKYTLIITPRYVTHYIICNMSEMKYALSITPRYVTHYIICNKI